MASASQNNPKFHDVNHVHSQGLPFELGFVKNFFIQFDEEKAETAEMAIRIARAVGGTPESWFRMQEALDLWTAEIKFKNNPSLAPKPVAA